MRPSLFGALKYVIRAFGESFLSADLRNREAIQFVLKRVKRVVQSTLAVAAIGEGTPLKRGPPPSARLALKLPIGKLPLNRNLPAELNCSFRTQSGARLRSSQCPQWAERGTHHHVRGISGFAVRQLVIGQSEDGPELDIALQEANVRLWHRAAGARPA